MTLAKRPSTAVLDLGRKGTSPPVLAKQSDVKHSRIPIPIPKGGVGE
jgi:hypothetical protein